MTKIEFIKEQIKEEIERLDKLEEERLLCKDYAGALKMESKREGCLRIWQIICCAENSKWEEYTVQENQLNGKQTNWLRDIKYRYFPQPRQEWSEEDEVRLQACLDTLQAKSLFGVVDTTITMWLKSLKERLKGE